MFHLCMLNRSPWSKPIYICRASMQASRWWQVRVCRVCHKEQWRLTDANWFERHLS